MKYILLSFIWLAFACKEQPDQVASLYVVPQGNAVYWAITPNIDSTALNLLSRTLLEHSIFFKPIVKRDKNGQLTELSGNIIVFDKTRIQRTDTLLSNHLILPNERNRWIASQSISVGHTKATLRLPPIGFWYDSTSGLHSDVVGETFPVALRSQVEKDFSSVDLATLTTQNAQRIKDFKTAVQRGKPAFAFTLPDSNGQLVRLSDYKGKVVYLDFWAHWCQPCMQEMNDIKRIGKRLNQHRDLALIYVSIDKAKDRDKWIRSIQKHKFLGLHLLDTSDNNESIARTYGVNSVPTKFIIDRNGKFYVTKLPYPTDEKELITQLEKALSEPQ